MVLLARTTPSGTPGVKSSQCLSLFFARIREDDGVTLKRGIEMRKIRKMGGRGVDSNEVDKTFLLQFYPCSSSKQIFFDNFEVPADDLIGQEGTGFKQFSTFLFRWNIIPNKSHRILHGMNAERCLLAGEALGIYSVD